MSSQAKERTTIISDLLLIIGSIALACGGFAFLETPKSYWIIGIALVAAFLFTLLLIHDLPKHAKIDKETTDQIMGLALLNEENGLVKQWTILGQNGLLIGKSNQETQADIDLSETTFESLISEQHALLNYADGNWYLEDCHSQNGVSIRKISDGIKYQLSQDKPCKIHKGDIICIANTQIIVK